jgi:branched-chain amino acid transport system substrate-binding protein
MWDVARRARPDADYLSTYYVHMWFTMMIFEEIVTRAMAAGDALDGPGLKTALESISDWDTGGFVGRPVSLASHSIPIGRVYQSDAASGLLNPVSDWIDMS